MLLFKLIKECDNDQGIIEIESYYDIHYKWVYQTAFK